MKNSDPSKIRTSTYLVTFDQGLGAGDVVRQFLGTDQAEHRVNPCEQVSVVVEEPLQVVRIQEFLFSAVGLGRELRPQLVDLLLLHESLFGCFRMGGHQAVGDFVQLFDLQRNWSTCFT